MMIAGIAVPPVFFTDSGAFGAHIIFAFTRRHTQHEDQRQQNGENVFHGALLCSAYAGKYYPLSILFGCRHIIDGL